MAAADIKLRLLFKRFEVEKFLGKGTFGSVYRVSRREDNKVYAVKETDLSNMSQIERQDAANEIRLLASIKHPNVIRYYEAFLDGNWLCIIMEYAACGDLSHYIKKGKEKETPLPEEVVWNILIQLMSGVNSLHQKKILHRDLKPANVFMGRGTSSDIVKIGDLGVAKILNKSAAANTQIGTPHYMAPEVWRGKPYSYSADIWSLGCVLYEMLTYRVPFGAGAKTIRELRANVMNGSTQPISSFYSSDLRGICKLMMEGDVRERPTITQLLEMPCIASRIRMQASTGDDASESSAPILDTIKVPASLKQLGSKLPGADYASSQDAAAGIKAVR